MSLFIATLLGCVEGLTEFLPISSTGHLILTQRLLGMQNTEMLASFDISIQLGAILAVVIVYAKTLMRNRRVWLPIGAAFVPTAIVGAMLHKVVKTYLLGSSTVVSWSLLVGGILIILFETTYRSEKADIHDIESIPLRTAIGIGLFQSLALIPGVSRSAATILGGMLLKVDRRTVVDFSFLLAIPTMAAATGLDLLKSYHSFTSHDALAIGVGFVAAFITALIAIRWLLVFIRSHSFSPFGVYRILVGLTFLLWIR